MFDTASEFQVGLNDPSPVTRVLILGYYDGATDGVLQLGDGKRVYRFDLIEDGAEAREFEFRPLAPESWDRLVAVIGEHIAPKWPRWAPVWRFPNPDIQAEVESKVDAILQRAGGVEWEITTPDPVGFTSLIARPMTLARAVAV